jgi:hypothetical protein
VQRRLLLLAAALCAAAATPVLAAPAPTTLQFAGRTWTIRPNGKGGPGPEGGNVWRSRNAFVDEKGQLHLKITTDGSRWFCSDVTTNERLGLGTYEFKVVGRPDLFDPNVVLGLFSYPTADVGEDGTHEIDIELARWGKAKWPPLNYTVYPTTLTLPYTTDTHEIALSGDQTVHSYVRSARKIRFHSEETLADGSARSLATWTFAPSDPNQRVSDAAMPVHINLWLRNPPTDGKPVEVVISAFKFKPAN